MPMKGNDMATKKRTKASLATTWLSVTDVREALTRSRNTHAKLTKRLAHLNGEVERTRETAEPVLAEFTPTERAKVLKRMIGTKRAELQRNTSDERRAHVRDLAAVRDRLASARAHYGSSVQMLMRHSLGSERRSRLIEQLAASGPTELASLGALAASTMDHELGAAVCSRLSQLDRAQRPFVAQDLADALVGAEYREVNKAIMEAERLTLEALTEDGAFETGQAAKRALKLALMKRDEAEFDEPEEDDVDHGETPEDTPTPDTEED
jgi:pimeloyl-ACP methyl ester carboxylesterase